MAHADMYHLSVTTSRFIQIAKVMQIILLYLHSTSHMLVHHFSHHHFYHPPLLSSFIPG